MSAIAKVFEFESSELRTTLIDDKPWFVAHDVCSILEFRMASDALRNLDEDEKGYAIVRTPGGDQRMSIVNESGVYALIFRSRTEGAKKFRKWVTDEVLPAVRETGSYRIAERDTNSPAVPQSFAQALRLAAEQQERIEAQAAQLEAAAPKVAYVDNFLRNNDACLIRQLAKRIGYKESELRKELMDRKVIFRVPIARFSESKGRDVIEYRYEAATAYMAWFRECDQPNAPRHHNDQMRTTLYVTPAGKVGIARLLGRLDATQPEIEGATA